MKTIIKNEPTYNSRKLLPTLIVKSKFTIFRLNDLIDCSIGNI